MLQTYPKLVGILVLALLWSPFFVLTKLTLVEFTPFWTGIVRCFISTGVLWAALFLSRHKIRHYLSYWRVFLILGTFGVALPFTLLAFGEIHGDSGTAGIIDGLSPAMTVLCSMWLFPKRAVSKKEFLSIVLGFLGISIIFVPTLKSFQETFDLDAVYMFLAAIVWSYSFVYIEKNTQQIPPLVSTAFQQLVAALVLLPFGVIFEGIPDFTLITASGWGAIFGLASFIMLSSLWYYKMVRSMSASHLAIASYLQPPLAIALGALFLHEVLPLEVYVGAAFILPSMFLAGSKH